MADISEEMRPEMASKFECPDCADTALRAAPNENMPLNPHEYDFRCRCGLLFNLSDVIEQL